MQTYKIILIIAVILIISELLFRLIYRLKYGCDYHVVVKFPLKRTYVTPHPFLSFAYKPGALIDRNQRLAYELHYRKYFSFHEPLRLNSYGHFGREFSLDKPENIIRIACLGASTTANNIADEQRDYTYPQLLEDYLNDHFGRIGIKKKAEVYNCGIGGWVSIDIMIDFLLNIQHTKPDYVILYHGFNDLHLHLMENIAPDYSHGRKNFGEVFSDLKRGVYLPKIKFWHLYEFCKEKTVGTGNMRNDILKMITRQEPDISKDYQQLEIEKNILKNILIVCRYSAIKCVLSSFALYKYRDDPLLCKYAEGVNIENRMILDLAREFGTLYVDQDKLIPKEKAYFADAIHFTPEGMELMARNFGQTIIADHQKDLEDK